MVIGLSLTANYWLFNGFRKSANSPLKEARNLFVFEKFIILSKSLMFSLEQIGFLESRFGRS